MMKSMRKTSILKPTLLAVVAGAVLAGCTGCGSKSSPETEKADSQVPKDVMQKTYQDRAGKP